MVAVTTIAFDSNASVYTGGRTARIDQYYNPNLKWEMIKMINMGLDFATKIIVLPDLWNTFRKKGIIFWRSTAGLYNRNKINVVECSRNERKWN